MSIQVTINNISDKELKNVWFELSLNKETEPYIASHIISYQSDKMDVTTFEKAQLMKEKDGKPMISGFIHTWDMLLTTDKNLDEYNNLKTDELAKSIKFLNVIVHWDGGKQEYTETLSLKDA